MKHTNNTKRITTKTPNKKAQKYQMSALFKKKRVSLHH